MTMTILPVAYLPSTEYFARLLRDECVIDIGEHFIKRSQRNRAYILTANGVMPLTVNVRNANRPRTPVRDVRIDYSKRWQHLHSMAIRSAYAATPFYEHYADALMPFYEKRYEFLTDYNLELLSLLLRLAHADRDLKVSDTYIEAAADDTDLRIKKRESGFQSAPYFQSFSDRFDFVSGVSFIDLLFAEGPSATDVLARCRW